MGQLPFHTKLQTIFYLRPNRQAVTQGLGKAQPQTLAYLHSLTGKDLDSC